MQKLKFDRSNHTQEEIENARDILLNFFHEVLAELESEEADKNEIDRVKWEIELLKNI